MITRWNPMRDMMNMQSTIDQMFDDAWRPFYDNNLAVDVDETDEHYIVTAAVPGLAPEDIDVRIRDGVLTISGELKEESEKTEENGKRVIMRERRYGKFSRSIRLNEAIDDSNLEASYENGVLKLEIPKTEEEGVRRIPVIAG